MAATLPELAAARERFLEFVADVRPDLHRYCSRLVGSAIDGEDVLQEALAKAYYALSLSPEVPALRPWLLRIAPSRVKAESERIRTRDEDGLERRLRADVQGRAHVVGVGRRGGGPLAVRVWPSMCSSLGILGD